MDAGSLRACGVLRQLDGLLKSTNDHLELFARKKHLGVAIITRSDHERSERTATVNEDTILPHINPLDEFVLICHVFVKRGDCPTPMPATLSTVEPRSYSTKE